MFDIIQIKRDTFILRFLFLCLIASFTLANVCIKLSNLQVLMNVISAGIFFNLDCNCTYFLTMLKIRLNLCVFFIQFEQHLPCDSSCFIILAPKIFHSENGFQHVKAENIVIALGKSSIGYLLFYIHCTAVTFKLLLILIKCKLM